MTLAEFITELQKYPQDMHISFEKDEDYGEWDVFILCRVKDKYPEIIGKFNTNDDTIEWVDLPTPPKYKRTGERS